MGLFGFGTKRKPAAEPATRRDRLNTPITRQRTDQQAGVEVSEFNLDDDDFSTMFGSGTSQFADAAFEQDDRAGDPWSSKRRLD
jgi:hypothetical protein